MKCIPTDDLIRVIRWFKLLIECFKAWNQLNVIKCYFFILIMATPLQKLFL